MHKIREGKQVGHRKTERPSERYDDGANGPNTAPFDLSDYFLTTFVSQDPRTFFLSTLEVEFTSFSIFLGSQNDLFVLTVH